MKKTAYLFSVLFVIAFMAITYLKPVNSNAQEDIPPSGNYWYQLCEYEGPDGQPRQGAECTTDQGHCGIITSCG